MAYAEFCNKLASLVIHRTMYVVWGLLCFAGAVNWLVHFAAGHLPYLAPSLAVVCLLAAVNCFCTATRKATR